MTFAEYIQINSIPIKQTSPYYFSSDFPTIPIKLDIKPIEQESPNNLKILIINYPSPKLKIEQPKSHLEFVNTFRPLIRKALTDRGLDPKYTDYLVAQTALESNWGKSESGRFNLSGIKGQGTTRRTKEYTNGRFVDTTDSFKDYTDYNLWIDDYVNLLDNNRYRHVFNQDEKQFASNILKAGYATDPDYAEKIDKLVKLIRKMKGGGVANIPSNILELINQTRERKLTYLSLDNLTKELKDLNKSIATRKLLGETIKNISLNTAKTALSIYDPIYLGTAITAVDSFTNPENAIVDAAATVLGKVNFLKLFSKQKGKNTSISNILPNVPSTVKLISYPAQNNSIRIGTKEVALLYNDSPNLKNVFDNGDGTFTLILDENIERRLKESGMAYGKSHPILFLKYNAANLYIYDSKTGIHYNLPKLPGYEDIAKARSEVMSKKGVAATTYSAKNSVYSDIDILYNRHNSEGKLYSSKSLVNISAHENGHLMQRLYGFSYDIPGPNGYGIADPNNPISVAISKYTKNTTWAKSINEHHSELIVYRIRKKIGSRDLTEEEAIEFIKSSPNLYSEEVMKNPPKELVDNLIKMAGISIPIGLDYENKNK